MVEVEKFLKFLRRAYPDIEFRYKYDKNDKWYRIYHTGERWIEETVGRYMDIFFMSKGILNVYFEKDNQNNLTK